VAFKLSTYTIQRRAVARACHKHNYTLLPCKILTRKLIMALIIEINESIKESQGR